MNGNNSRTELLREQFIPHLLLTVYKAEQHSFNFYIESHDIVEGKVMAGKPLRTDTIAAILDSMYEEEQNKLQVSGLFPENLLLFQTLAGGKYKMIWYHPEQPRKMFFKPELKIPNGWAVVPPMVYAVSSGQLSVFALSSNERPGHKTPLYRAPFFNVDDDGEVCLGDAKVEKPKTKTYENLIKYWEDLFWLSKFTHVNGGNPVKNIDLDVFWRSMIEFGNDASWTDNNKLVTAYQQLIKTKETLSDLL